MQTNYTQNQARAGMMADSRIRVIESYSADAAIGYGLAAKAGADVDNSVALVSADTDVFRGITHFGINGVGEYEANDAVNVVRKGIVWVETADAVATDAPAYVDVATGKFTDVATDNLATGGKFRSANAGAGLAKLEIDL